MGASFVKVQSIRISAQFDCGVGESGPAEREGQGQADRSPEGGSGHYKDCDAPQGRLLVERDQAKIGRYFAKLP